MDKCSKQVDEQRARLHNALNEKDSLLSNRDAIDKRVEELDKIILEARAIIVGVQYAVKVHAEESKPEAVEDGTDA